MIAQSRQASQRMPKGWRIARLGDLCEIVIGRTPRRDTVSFWGGDLPWVSISDLRGEVVVSTAECITKTGAAASRSRLVKKGTLLFSFKLSIGKMAFAGCDLYTNEAIAALIPFDGQIVDTAFLRYALASLDTSRGSSHAVKGRTLNRDGMRSIEVPLPPVSEQKRIVGILKEQMAIVEKAHNAAESQLDAAQSLRHAFIRKTFSAESISEWGTMPMDDIATLIIDGPHVTPSYVAEGIPFVTVRNIVNRQLDFTETSFVTAADHESFAARGRAEPGDILYSKDGTLGTPCVVDTDRQFSFFVSVALIKLRRDIADPRFVAYALESPHVLAQVERLGAGAGLKHMVLRSIRALDIPLPPLLKQRELASSLGYQLSGAQQVLNAVVENSAAVDAVPSALLRKAFSGEI